MADEELPLFDPNLKKKKKKKKTPFDLDAAMGENESGAADGAPSAPAEEAAEEPVEKPDEEVFGGLKKKKKKKKPFDLDEVGEALPQDGGEGSEALGQNEGDEGGAEDEATDETFSLDFSIKKKKRRRKRVDFGEQGVEEDMEDEETNDKDGKLGDTKSWIGSDRDYTYDELLTRVFDIMREKNPDMVAGEKKKFVMRPPQVLRVGTRKSSFANFADICRLLHRQPKHVLAFLLAELGTSGSVDGNNQLIIRGKYNQKQIENVLRRYIKEYVTCHTCRSPDTLLQKDTRLFFLQCETCGSRCSVASIKSGFQAVTGKRAAIRAKTT
ncbi:eukaryotic translation initiation factor 2 subunit 2-like isoform X1 [Haliotis rufescens]|uniref:eukaryotic translation initiation factor 2 subunit 2-like isoform X1 n=1 Tax=Haliotis rufescens TaxID=6454 RepID=UPI001EAFF7C7|nr:eukaryotic translation initiation factor 2 subunit 2-like isoform X1 [Haliotis rufescens]